MVVTPEDIINKRFTITKIRPGYDQDEVDDFLDEVARDLRTVLQEKSDLQAQLAMAQAGGGAPVTSVTPVQVPPVVTPPPAPEPISAPEPAGLDETESSSNILQLARRVYAEHVNEGRIERDRLIEEGTKSAEELVSSAKAQADSMMAELETQRLSIVRQIQDLQLFEEDYRSSLRDYLESQLKEVTNKQTMYDQSGGGNLNLSVPAESPATGNSSNTAASGVANSNPSSVEPSQSQADSLAGTNETN
jgi:DivIVA domain-containing protein